MSSTEQPPPPPMPKIEKRSDIDRSRPGWTPQAELADGDDYGQMDGGQWLDPDSSEPAQFYVPEIPPGLGRAWSRRELRAFRDGNLPVLPIYDPETRRTVRAVGVAPDNPAPAALAGAPANMDDRGTVHFLRIIGGSDDHCGGCEQPWPCEGYKATRAELSVSTDAGPRYMDPADVQTLLGRGTAG